MDTKTFWQEAGLLIDEYSLADHPIVSLIHEGKATRDQLGRYAIEHYELTIRDAGRSLSQGYLSMVDIDEERLKISPRKPAAFFLTAPPGAVVRVAEDSDISINPVVGDVLDTFL